MPADSTVATLPGPPVVVIDTNVVLDLYVFHDPRAQLLRHHLDAGHLSWLTTEAMLAELADVIRRPLIARVCHDADGAMAQVRLVCRVVPDPVQPAVAAPVCADPDDQMFIALAWCWPAAWLLTRDRALLDLAKRALARGVGVTTPARWAGPGSNGQDLSAPAQA
jgi:putative PIN family toxin of toxin-antitoxin system